ncbi:hypothetical protein Micbo1qcDRAFT_39355 [Microdochium bolleyi]|uniref:Uncharacterized protein n=1 Tax=Microdochium bolleyi TaxID=196109 RepID=A0A136J9H2_9PEZI|nr:hypothetical protein Micbo1qcDRAFT_39355 [Microdochium bolleyi]
MVLGRILATMADFCMGNNTVSSLAKGASHEISGQHISGIRIQQHIVDIGTRYWGPFVCRLRDSQHIAATATRHISMVMLHQQMVSDAWQGATKGGFSYRGLDMSGLTLDRKSSFSWCERYGIFPRAHFCFTFCRHCRLGFLVIYKGKGREHERGRVRA